MELPFHSWGMGVGSRIRFVAKLGSKRLGGGLLPESPSLHDPGKIQPAEKAIGQSVRLVGDRVAPLDLPELARLALHRILRPTVQPLVVVRQERLAALLAQGDAAGNRLEKLRLHPPAGKQEKSRTLGQDAKRLDQVVHERRLVVVVGVQESQKGIEPSTYASAIDN